MHAFIHICLYPFACTHVTHTHALSQNGDYILYTVHSATPLSYRIGGCDTIPTYLVSISKTSLSSARSPHHPCCVHGMGFDQAHDQHLGWRQPERGRMWGYRPHKSYLQLMCMIIRLGMSRECHSICVANLYACRAVCRYPCRCGVQMRILWSKEHASLN